MQKLEAPLSVKRDQIEEALERIAVEISHRYRNGVTIIGVLKAASRMIEDLHKILERMGVRHMTGSIGVQSFEGEDRKQKMLFYATPSLHLTHKKPVVILDTICDSGRTLQAAGRFLLQKPWRPSTIECGALVCALDPLPEWLQPAYVGFQIPTEHNFLVGYGLDYNDTLRNLDEIREIAEEDKVLKDEPKYATV